MNRKLEENTNLPGMQAIVGVAGRVILAVLLVLVAGQPGSAQFVSGSNGSDGALNLVTPGTFDWDPAVAPFTGLDPDGDHVFHFTTINIGAGVTVRLTTDHFNGPVYWLATGAVTINGIVDLNGQDGYSCTNTLPNYSLRRPALGGAGGYNGGVGGWSAGPFALSSQPGSGPGGGANAPSGSVNGTGGTHTGNQFEIPLIGGSGGGGAFSAATGCFAGGGGGGGGAILIASSVSITVTSPGTIRANGGAGGIITFICCQGGGGSGGAIRLMAPLIQGNGSVSAAAGSPTGTVGRIRLEAYQQSLTGSSSPPAILAAPSLLATVLPTGPPPSLRVSSIFVPPSTTVPLPADPSGSFTVPDATINDGGVVTLNIQASNIPTGTVVTLRISSETGADITTASTALTGSLASSTATATATFPAGFSRGYLRATW